MKLFIPAELRAEAVKMLCSMQGILEISRDYLGSWVQERDHPCPYILYIEHWRTEEAMHNHIRSSLYRRVLAVIEFSTRAPEVNFYLDSQPEGLKLVELLRHESNSKKSALS